MPRSANPALLFLPLSLFTGCVAAPEPAAPPPATVAVVPPPTPARDGRPSPGDWRYARGAGETSATFDRGAAALVCRPSARTVTLSVGAAPGGPVTIRTTSATRRVAAGPDGTVALAATDPLLDAMAFSRGRFVVEATGAAPLILPAQAEIGRVIEDCRG